MEFDWDQDIYLARQIVTEKLNTAQVPDDMNSVLGPISSIMWEIQLIWLSSPNGKVSPGELRSLADWTVRPRLLTISWISQVTVIGGEREEYQILLDPLKIANLNLSLDTIMESLEWVIENKSGGFLVTPSGESAVRIISQTNSLETIWNTIVTQSNGIPIQLKDIAEVVKWPASNPRWDAGINWKKWVILSIQKQPKSKYSWSFKRCCSYVEWFTRIFMRGYKTPCKFVYAREIY